MKELLSSVAESIVYKAGIAHDQGLDQSHRGYPWRTAMPSSCGTLREQLNTSSQITKWLCLETLRWAAKVTDETCIAVGRKVH